MDFFQQRFSTVKVAYINCMSMWSTTHVYAAILSTLFSVNEKKKSAAKSLSNYLQNNHSKHNEYTKIVILD
jgi:Cdc6-like AAA superfamily ATPase